MQKILVHIMYVLDIIHLALSLQGIVLLWVEMQKRLLLMLFSLDMELILKQIVSMLVHHHLTTGRCSALMEKYRWQDFRLQRMLLKHTQTVLTGIGFGLMVGASRAEAQRATEIRAEQ